jgi:hypothetical protein
MDILHYTVDIAELLRKQEQHSKLLDEQAEIYKGVGLENKKELLKYVLPLMHGIFALHNNKCHISSASTSGYHGLLGYSKYNIEEKLQHIVDTESSLTWSNNFQTFSFENFGGNNFKEVKIWLNKRHGCHQSTPHLPYSVKALLNTSESTYGSSIESELENLAKYCAIYKDNWKE